MDPKFVACQYVTLTKFKQCDLDGKSGGRLVELNSDQIRNLNMVGSGSLTVQDLCFHYPRGKISNRLVH